MVKEPMQVGGYEFDIGTVLVPCIYLAHRRPEVTPEPGLFKRALLKQKFSAYEFLAAAVAAASEQRSRCMKMKWY